METKFLILLAVVLLTTGCAEDSSKSREGIVVEDFSVADSELQPNQETVVELTISNYNKASTTLKSENVEMFNTGQLEKKNKNCNPEEIGSAREGLNPKMNCRWKVEAPDEDFVRGFSSKPLSINVFFNYKTTLETEDPLNIEISENSAETSTEEIVKEASNDEVKLSASTVSPVPVNGNRVMNIELDHIGGGSLESNYNITCTPENIFTECPKQKEPLRGETSITTMIESDVEGTRKAFFSTSYKYERVLNRRVTVVDN